MINEYYIKKLNQIEKDEMQLKAYNSKGNTVVLAGPGSGKTTVLTLKVMRLLHESIYPPRGLACLTYSREAAREFQDRLKLLGLEKRQSVFLGTVHSFCLTEILIPFSKLYPDYNIPYPIKIISNLEKSKIFSEVKSVIGDQNLRVDEMDKERTRDIEGFSKIEIPSYAVALKAATIFESKLIEKGYCDYISIVKNATLLIQKEEYVRKAVEAKFPWLIIDEYQDLGKPLHEMVLGLLLNTNIKIFAVGDADQSIYDFQGAAPEYLRELSTMSKINKCINLIHNYRSAKGIIDASEIVLAEKRNYISKGELKDFNAIIDFYVCEEDMDEQYHKAVEIVKECNQQGIPFHEIAILAGYQNQLKELSRICIENNIPFYLAKQEFERSDFIKWLESCASWILNNEKFSFDDIYKYWEYLLINHDFSVNTNNRIQYKRKLYGILKESVIYNASLYEWINFIFNSLNINNILSESKIYPDELDNLIRLNNIISKEPYDKFNIKQFKMLGTPENQVVLSTRHGSKGLEFDVVLLLGMEEGNFPRYNSNMNEIKEAHRLCFVSVSRARKRCVLIRSKYINITTRNGEIWHKPCEPSPFWNLLYNKKQLTLKE